MLPWADAIFACDLSWWEKNKPIWQDHPAMKFTWSKDAARRFGLRWVMGKKAEGLGTKHLNAGGSSGYMAVNLAYFMGAVEIYLLGFDMQYTGGQSHWHGDHKKTSNPSRDMLSKWAERFVAIHADLWALGIPLINCTRESALTIPRKTLEEVLDGPKPRRILEK